MNLASLHLYVTCMSMALVRCMTGQTLIGWCFLMHFNGIFSLLMMYVIWCIARAFFLRCSFKVIWVRCLCRIWFEVCAMKVSYFFFYFMVFGFCIIPTILHFLKMLLLHSGMPWSESHIMLSRFHLQFDLTKTICCIFCRKDPQIHVD